MLTDNGVQFTSHEFEIFLKNRNIQHLRTSNYYPRCNGLLERFHRNLKECIISANLEHKSVCDYVSQYLFVYRATPHATTELSPALLLHGRELKTKLNIVKVENKPVDSDKLHATVKQKQSNMKKHFDKNHNVKIPNFKVGDYVRIKKQVKPHKGKPGYTKPYQIEKLCGKFTYKLSDGKRWNAKHLTISDKPDENNADLPMLPSAALANRPVRNARRNESSEYVYYD